MAEYIDRDYVIKDLETHLTKPDGDHAKGYNLGINAACSVLSCILPADVAPVVHGHWIDTNNYYQRWKCSICGNHTRDAGPNYCPNCGARMDEGYKYDPSRHFAHFVMTED